MAPVLARRTDVRSESLAQELPSLDLQRRSLFSSSGRHRHRIQEVHPFLDVDRSGYPSMAEGMGVLGTIVIEHGDSGTQFGCSFAQN